MQEVMNSGNPKLSIVVTSRNDDHGGNLLRRMQIFVKALIEQCKRHNLLAELILIEWNPPDDKQRLSEALTWPVKGGLCTVRIIEVPCEVHRRFRHSEYLPLFQMIAKNVGIRRARGEFVLATNIDVLFPDELMQFLSSNRFEYKKLYRLARYDVPADIPFNATVNEQLEFCRNNIIRICNRDIILDLKTCESCWTYLPSSPIGLLKMTGVVFRDIVMSTLFKRGEKFQPEPMNNIASKLASNDRWQYISYNCYVNWLRLFTNACGDFTLMSRKDWFDVRGYPELEVFSLHIDSLLLYLAYFKSIREVVLKSPLCIYHIDHAGSWILSSKQTDEVFGSKRDMPWITFEQFREWIMTMRKKRSPIIFNVENWGLADDALPEIVIDVNGETYWIG